MLHIITRVTRHLIFWTLFSIAFVLSAIRIALFCLDFYKAELEVKFTQLLDAPVKIGKIHAHLGQGLKPELLLNEINLSSTSTASKPSIELKEIRLGLDLFALIKQQQIIPASWVTLVGAKLTVIYKPDGSLAVLGLQGDNEPPNWLLQGRHYQLLESEITWLDEKNHRIPHTFKQVDISIKNNLNKQRHFVNLLSHLPRAYGDSLRISTDFTGDVFSPNAVNGRLFIDGKNLHFAKLIDTELPLKLQIKNGSGDVELWGSVQNSQLSALSGQIHSQNLTLQRSDDKKLQFTQLNTQFDWRNQINNWSLAVDNLTIGLPQKNYLPARFYLGSNNKTAQQLSANIKNLDLEAVQTVAEFFAQDLTGFKNLSGLKVKGQLHNTLGFADLKQQNFAIKGEFLHLSIAAPAPYPQLQNLSGFINGTEKQGVLTLNTQNANFVAQPMFRAPLAITQLAGQLHWQQAEKSWLLSTAHLQLNTPYAQSNNQFKITIPKNAEPVFVDVQTAFFNLNDVSNAKVYFPVTLMSKELLRYLDEAFIKGQVKRGDFLLYGYLKDFPFIKHQGVFQVLFDAEDVTMNYAEGWPFFQHLDARILFENDGLEVNIKQAQAERATINQAKITIPSFSDSQYVFVEDGLFSSEINDGLNYLRHTPLPLPLKSVSEQLTITGNTQGELALKIPLSDKVAPKVTGSAKVANAKLKVLAVDLPINNLSGVFRFTENGFYSDVLQATGLGYPLQAKVSLKSDSTEIDVSGKTSVRDLEQQFNFSTQDLIRGSSNYSLQLNLPFAEKNAPQLTVNTDLHGVSLALPDSLAKIANDEKALKLHFDLMDGALLPISFAYDNQLQANLLVKKADKTLAAGEIAFPGFKNQQSLKAGEFKIKINQPHFSAPVWLAALDKLQASSEKAQLLTDLEIHTPQLNWSEQQLGEFDLKLQRNADHWSGTIDADAIKGQLQIPLNSNADEKIRLDMTQIDLSSLMRLKLPKQTTPHPAKLPLFQLDSDAVLLRGINLGKLKLDTERDDNGVKFKTFTLTGKDRLLSLTGDWFKQGNHDVTEINGKLTAKDFGALLRKLDFNDDLQETDAEISLNLHWQGAPYQFSLSSLSGSMDVYFNSGRISSIEPGFGRLLGVLAMEQWLKRLQLDFGDIYKEGLSFNDITGHFSLSNGKMTTENLTVDAIPATINLTGELNLPEQTLDQQISVIPKSLDAVPIAGTIVDRIATTVTQVLTGEYEAGFYLRSKYRVKGKWNALNVMPLHEQDGLLTKTWRGLTDFSWITQQKQD